MYSFVHLKTDLQKERKGDCKREIFYPLVHSLTGCSGRSWAGLNPGARIHTFKTSKNRWTVLLKTNAVDESSVETDIYVPF